MRKFLLSILSLLCCVATFAGEYTETFSFASANDKNNQTITKEGVNSTGGDVEFSLKDGSILIVGTACYNPSSKTNFTCYKAGSFTISFKPGVDGKVIKSVTIKYNKSCYPLAEAVPDGGSATVKTTAIIDGTYTASGGGVGSVTFTNVAGGKTEMKSIVVVYADGTATPTPKPVAVYDVPSEVNKYGVTTSTINFTSNDTLGLTNSQTVARKFTSADLVYEFAKGSGSTAPTYYEKGDAVRFYAKNTLKISSKKNIARIEFKWVTEKIGSNVKPSIENIVVTTTPGDAGEYDCMSGVWTGEANEVIFTNTSTNKEQFWIQEIKVYYDDDESADDAATKAAKQQLLTEIGKAYAALNEASQDVGVNVFQFKPAAIGKYGNAIDYAQSHSKYIHTDMGVYCAIDELRNAYKAFQPTLPEVNKTYVISLKNKANSQDVKYINIDGDKPTLSDAPSYIQFMASGEMDLKRFNPVGPETWENERGEFFFPNLWYLYNTKNRRYLGCDARKLNVNDKEYGKLTYDLSLYDNKSCSQFIVSCNNNDEWRMYEPTSGFPLVAVKERLCVANSVESYQNTADYKYVWYIEQIDEPEPETPSAEEEESSGDVTAIVSANASANVSAIYNAAGSKLNGLQKGLNIVKMSDNTVKKVLVK